MAFCDFMRFYPFIHLLFCFTCSYHSSICGSGFLVYFLLIIFSLFSVFSGCSDTDEALFAAFGLTAI